MKLSRWSGPPCPQDAEHDRLLDSPSATAAWYCPHVAHTGTPFYGSDLAPVSRTGPDGDSAPEARGHRGQPGRPAARPDAPSSAPDPDPPRVGDSQLILPAPVGRPGIRPPDVTGSGRPYPPQGRSLPAQPRDPLPSGDAGVLPGPPAIPEAGRSARSPVGTSPADN
jgi:hypothetical protein